MDTYSHTQTVHGNFPVDQYQSGDIRHGATAPDSGPAVPDTTYTPTGDAAIRVAMSQHQAGQSAIDVANMSDAGTHSAG